MSYLELLCGAVHRFAFPFAEFQVAVHDIDDPLGFFLIRKFSLKIGITRVLKADLENKVLETLLQSDTAS